MFGKMTMYMSMLLEGLVTLIYQIHLLDLVVFS